MSTFLLTVGGFCCKTSLIRGMPFREELSQPTHRVLAEECSEFGDRLHRRHSGGIEVTNPVDLDG